MFQQQLKKPQKKPVGQQPKEGEQPFKWNRFQARYDEEKKQAIQLPIGIVKIISVQQPILGGYRKLKIQQGKKYKEQLQKMLDHWSIVGFDRGALDGRGYGFNIRDQCGAECGETFIIKPKAE